MKLMPVNIQRPYLGHLRPLHLPVYVHHSNFSLCEFTNGKFILSGKVQRSDIFPDLLKVNSQDGDSLGEVLLRRVKTGFRRFYDKKFMDKLNKTPERI